MAAPTEGKASSGSPFRPPPAVIWNNMIEAGRAWADGRLSNESPPPTRPRESDIIKVRNDSGAARRKGEILRIEGSALTDVVDEHIWLLGVEPTAEGYFGILKRPCETSAVESLQVSGCCLALVTISDLSHTRAKAADGSYVLESSDDGPVEILYAPDGTGEKECVVRFAGSGGGGGHEIWFSIDSVYCEDSYDSWHLIVTPTYYSRGCAAAIPGADEYTGQVDIYDICNTHGFYTDEWLVGKVGRATYMYPRTGECLPLWLLDTICGTPECA